MQAQAAEQTPVVVLSTKHGKKPAHSLKPGDVLVAQWGATMIIIDFYQVTKLVGSTMVEVTEITSEEKGDGFLTGTSVPLIGQFVKNQRHEIERGDGEFKTFKRVVKPGERIFIKDFIIAERYDASRTYRFDHCD